jgi:hypothetical protein
VDSADTMPISVNEVARLGQCSNPTPEDQIGTTVVIHIGLADHG